MDPSISDILASVTRAHNAAAAANGLALSSPTEQQEDLQALTRAWVSERVAPELLPYPTELMERTMQRLRSQVSIDIYSSALQTKEKELLTLRRRLGVDRKIENIEDRTARMDAGTSFALVVIQTELERFKFLVRSFLRARISKIDAHPQYLITIAQSQPPSSKPLLSPEEQQYLHTHAALLERHYNASFLSAFPPKLRRLDDKAGAGGVGMVEGPDVDQAVFVRCLGSRQTAFRRPRVVDMDADDDGRVIGADGEPGESFGSVEVSCGYTQASGADAAGAGSSSRDGAAERGEAGDRIVSMQRGDVWIVRWSSVRDAVARGECELI